MAASELKSNMSDVNLNKAKRSYFYILIIAMHTKQILLKRYDFLYIVNISENLKKIDEKKCFKHYNRATYLNPTQAIM